MKFKIILITLSFLTLNSCCNCWCEGIPSLRQMQEWDEDNPPDYLIIEGYK